MPFTEIARGQEVQPLYGRREHQTLCLYNLWECGNGVTTLKMEEKYRRFYTTYKMQKLRVLDLANKDHLEEFLQWHRCIITWGLTIYMTDYVQDLERYMGMPKRESLAV